MKKTDLPSMQWYWGDWFKAPDVQALPRELRCLWFEMIGRMWESPERGFLLMGNGKPPSNEDFARIFGFGEDSIKGRAFLVELIDRGICSVRESDGAVFCRRMVKDEQTRNDAVKFGKKGGNPLFKTSKKYSKIS